MAWRHKKLGDLAEVSSGGTPKKANKKFWAGDIPWYSSGELNEHYTSAPKEFITNTGLEGSNAKLFPAGSLLIGMYDTAALKMSILDREGAFNQAIAGVKPNKNLDMSFVLYAITNIKPELLNQRRGVRQKNLSLQKIKDIPIPNVGITEQKHIVTILDQAFADIDKARALTEQNLKNARELFESYLRQVFSPHGDEWVDYALDDLVTDDCSLSYGIVQPGNDVEDGLPVVRPTDLDKPIIDLDGLKLIDPALATGYQRTTLQGGELLLCVRGSTGVTSIADESLAGANVTRGIVPIRFNPEKMAQKFGYYQMISPLIQEQIKVGTYGAALMQINIRDLRKIRLLAPSMSVQREIIQNLDLLKTKQSRVEEIYRLKLSAFEELKKSILQNAFSGKLTSDYKEAAA